MSATQNIEMANDISSAVKGRLDAFGQMMKSLQTEAEGKTVTELTDLILDKTGYLKALKDVADHDLQAQSRIDNLNEFKSVTQEFDHQQEGDVANTQEKLTNLLTNLALVSPQDDIEDQANTVTLMTLHAAKGLEFPVVFLIGMEQSIFPLARSLQHSDQEEEDVVWHM